MVFLIINKIFNANMFRPNNVSSLKHFKSLRYESYYFISEAPNTMQLDFELVNLLVNFC